MPRKKIREYDAKKLISDNLHRYANMADNGTLTIPFQCILVDSTVDLNDLEKKHQWLLNSLLVVKPDQLFGRKGKNNLVLLNASWEDAKLFIRENLGRTINIGGLSGELTHFLIEPFVKHSEEYFLSIMSQRNEDIIFFSTKGGVDVEEHWHKIRQIPFSCDAPPLPETDMRGIIENKLLHELPSEKKSAMAHFIQAIYRFYVDLDIVYLEFNPLTFTEDNQIKTLGVVAELDSSAFYKEKWNGVSFAHPFGRKQYPEEKFVAELDSKTGASLKLTVLNSNGRIWLLAAGGGASVIYADTVVDLGYGAELGNYGEYSGDPNEEDTYQYARTILDLATSNPLKSEKALIIGGGIANFTDVAKTFKGIIRALREYKKKLIENNFSIYVRRGGPNYEAGLKQMKELEKELELPIEVYGPETHMTKIVALAIKELAK